MPISSEAIASLSACHSGSCPGENPSFKLLDEQVTPRGKSLNIVPVRADVNFAWRPAELQNKSQITPNGACAELGGT